MNPKRLPVALAIVLCASAAQSQVAHNGPAAAIALAATLPSYDVVSIKQNKSGTGSYSLRIGDDRMIATNVPLKNLVEIAYDTKDNLLFGISGPASSASFDIEAKTLGPDGGTPPKLSDQQLLAMTISLLADRFHLKAHLQTKILPAYDLVVAKGGPKMELSQEERTDSSWDTNRSIDDLDIHFKGVAMADIASALSDAVGRTVFDKTGLKGRVDALTLKWTDENAADTSGAPVVSVFTAVEEQLGLKLEPSKGPVETLVVDHVEMPSEN
jgi:uncharacterized protein (TIGR03435 family)